MGQLILRSGTDIEITEGWVVPQMARLLQKVDLSLSRSQLNSLCGMMTVYFQTTKLTDTRAMSNYFLLYKVWDKKIRTKKYSFKDRFKFRFDIAQANALYDMFDDFDLSNWPYESSIRDYITGEIYRQTI
jgi:hypothetical protein